jgi:hypothetical protein
VVEVAGMLLQEVMELLLQEVQEEQLGEVVEEMETLEETRETNPEVVEVVILQLQV